MNWLSAHLRVNFTNKMISPIRTLASMRAQMSLQGLFSWKHAVADVTTNRACRIWSNVLQCWYNIGSWSSTLWSGNNKNFAYGSGWVNANFIMYPFEMQAWSLKPMANTYPVGVDVREFPGAKAASRLGEEANWDASTPRTAHTAERWLTPCILLGVCGVSGEWLGGSWCPYLH